MLNFLGFGSKKKNQFNHHYQCWLVSAIAVLMSPAYVAAQTAALITDNSSSLNSLELYLEIPSNNGARILASEGIDLSEFVPELDRDIDTIRSLASDGVKGYVVISRPQPSSVDHIHHLLTFDLGQRTLDSYIQLGQQVDDIAILNGQLYGLTNDPNFSVTNFLSVDDDFSPKRYSLSEIQSDGSLLTRYSSPPVVLPPADGQYQLLLNRATSLAANAANNRLVVAGDSYLLYSDQFLHQIDVNNWESVAENQLISRGFVEPSISTRHLSGNVEVLSQSFGRDTGLFASDTLNELEVDQSHRYLGGSLQSDVISDEFSYDYSVDQPSVIQFWGDYGFGADKNYFRGNRVAIELEGGIIDWATPSRSNDAYLQLNSLWRLEGDVSQEAIDIHDELDDNVLLRPGLQFRSDVNFDTTGLPDGVYSLVLDPQGTIHFNDASQDTSNQILSVNQDRVYFAIEKPSRNFVGNGSFELIDPETNQPFAWSTSRVATLNRRVNNTNGNNFQSSLSLDSIFLYQSLEDTLVDEIEKGIQRNERILFRMRYRMDTRFSQHLGSPDEVEFTLNLPGFDQFIISRLPYNQEWLELNYWISPADYDLSLDDQFFSISAKLLSNGLYDDRSLLLHGINVDDVFFGFTPVPSPSALTIIPFAMLFFCQRSFSRLG